MENRSFPTRSASVRSSLGTRQHEHVVLSTYKLPGETGASCWRYTIELALVSFWSSHSGIYRLCNQWPCHERLQIAQLLGCAGHRASSVPCVNIHARPQALGLVLPWFGPMVGLFVTSPIIEMGIAQSRWLTKDTQCFKEDVNQCNGTSTYQYYFWNLTNPDEVLRTFCASSSASSFST